MNDLAKEIKEGNENFKMNINANAEDIGKCISDLCTHIYELKQDCKFLSQEIRKTENFQDTEEILRLFKKYNE